MKQAVIVAAARSAVGRAKRGTLRLTRPDDFGGVVLKELVKRSGVDPTLIDDLIVGNAMPEGCQGMNFARILSFTAGLPIEVAAVTVNRFCASGLETISMAANKVICGDADIVVAGGCESMTMVPMGGFNPSPNPRMMMEWPETYSPMGITAEKVANLNQRDAKDAYYCEKPVTREEQDKYAYESHMKAVKAIEAGVFKDQIVPVQALVEKQLPNGRFETKEVTFDTDECPRGDTTIEGLAKLRPVFAMKGSVTAGNSSPMNDGAAFVMIMSEDKAKELGCKPLAYVRTCVSVGTPPEIMGVGPLYAIRKLFKRTGLTKDDIDLFEINEAFASQALYCVRELGLDTSKINVNGGAIALGHPLGCTGGKLTTQLLYEMQKRKAKYGIVSMCIGGGMGAAGLFERYEG